MSNEGKKPSIKRYATEAELRSAHPAAKEYQYGAVMKYDGREFVQLYFGHHEWAIVCLDDPDEFHPDLGSFGTEFGYAFVDIQDKEYWIKIACAAERWQATPEDWDVKPEGAPASL